MKYDHESGESWDYGVSEYEDYGEPTLQEELSLWSFAFICFWGLNGVLVLFNVLPESWFIASSVAALVMVLYSLIVPRFMK